MTASKRDKDITDLVSYDLPDGDCLPVNKCAYGHAYESWDFILMADRETPTTCKYCGRSMYFKLSICIMEIA